MSPVNPGLIPLRNTPEGGEPLAYGDSDLETQNINVKQINLFLTRMNPVGKASMADITQTSKLTFLALDVLHRNLVLMGWTTA